MPIYFYSQSVQITAQLEFIVIATCGVVVGTVLGLNILNRIPENTFRKTVAVIILMLGVAMVYQGCREIF